MCLYVCVCVVCVFIFVCVTEKTFENNYLICSEKCFEINEGFPVFCPLGANVTFFWCSYKYITHINKSALAYFYIKVHNKIRVF